MQLSECSGVALKIWKFLFISNRDWLLKKINFKVVEGNWLYFCGFMCLYQCNALVFLLLKVWTFRDDSKLDQPQTGHVQGLLSVAGRLTLEANH